MARAKHNYYITINKKPRGNEPYAYKYGQTKDVRMALCKGGVSIRFEMAVLKTPEDFSMLRVNLFRDSLRKAYLMHAILFDSALVIKSIQIEIDGSAATFDKKTPHFPFVFCMLSSAELNLGSICNHSGLIKAILSETKTSSTWEEKNCALFAYMLSKERTYEVDRFLNLWTAMNSLYNMITRQFESAMRKQYEASQTDFPKKYKIHKVDNPSLGALICLIKPDCIFPKRPDDKLEYKEAYRTISRRIEECGSYTFEDLYESALTELKTGKRKEKYAGLFDLADRVGVPLYIFLLVVYPYWLRCNYFHGSKAQPILAAYIDPEYRDLKLINAFLDSFFSANIPKMFGEESLSDKEVDLIQYYLKAREK